MASYFSPGLNERCVVLKMNSEIWRLGDIMYTRGAMRGCGEAQGGPRVPARSTCSLCAHRRSSGGLFSPALSERKCHPASAEDFSCCGLKCSQYTPQLLLCLTYSFFLLSHTRLDLMSSCGQGWQCACHLEQPHYHHI